MTPDSFAGWCGPRALCAILDTPTQGWLASACARDLIAAGAEPPTTSVAAMSIALERHGFGVKPHDPISGKPCCAIRDLEPAPAPLLAWRQVIETAPLPDVEKCLSVLYADYRPLADWLPRVGAWLYVVVLERSAHWVAARGGRVLTRDGDYANRRVSAALRICQP